MTRAYKTLLRLYPIDIRVSYGAEMVGDYDIGLGEHRRRGQIALGRFVASQLMWLLCDVAGERVSNLYSHRSLHGRCLPNPGVVRPPNMGKQEWFYGSESDR
jgi:hypothetical protein